ncbi:actin-associated protein FAM107A [Centroberyx gerrardi]|uniref:actin-associated protein FAM107A n=1 Tax=Centroberyx gerrardi TaxID=166262 RepID=UPI003AAF4EEC
MGGSVRQIEVSVHIMQTHQDGQEDGEDLDLCPELQALPSQLQSEEESSDLIRPQKLLNPLIASKSHQELHKELRMTHKRGVSREGKTELQRVLEKRKWEQRMKVRRDQEEAKKNRSPLHQELLKRHQRLDKVEREKGQQQEEPEFLRVKERLRRTTTLDAGENEV